MKKMTLFLIIMLLLVLPVYGIAISSATSMQEKEDSQSEEAGMENQHQNAQGASNEAVRVEIKQDAFEPAEIRIQPGTTVTWYNLDAVSHTITSGTNQEGNLAPLCYPWKQLVTNKIDLFDSGTVEPKQEYSITFEDTVEFNYFSRFNPNMEGKIIVTE